MQESETFMDNIPNRSDSQQDEKMMDEMSHIKEDHKKVYSPEALAAYESQKDRKLEHPEDMPVIPAIKNPQGKLLIVDGHSLAFRAFYALPVENFSTGSGQATNAVYGFATMLVEVLKKYRPTHICVAFDVRGGTFRHIMLKQYKGTRQAAPEEFQSQIPLIQKLLEALNVPIIEMPGYEADDVIASLSLQAEKDNYQVLVLSGDRDAFQLVDDNVTVLFPGHHFKDLKEVTPDYVMEKYKVTPHQYPDIAALRGENSDNIPGVPGVGDGYAATWINKYGSLEGIFEHADEITGKKGEALRENIDQVKLNRCVNAVVRNLDCHTPFSRMKFQGINTEKLNKVLEELQFGIKIKTGITDIFAQLSGDSKGHNGQDHAIVPSHQEPASIQEITKQEEVRNNLLKTLQKNPPSREDSSTGVIPQPIGTVYSDIDYEMSPMKIEDDIVSSSYIEQWAKKHIEEPFSQSENMTQNPILTIIAEGISKPGKASLKRINILAPDRYFLSISKKIIENDKSLRELIQRLVDTYPFITYDYTGLLLMTQKIDVHIPLPIADVRLLGYIVNPDFQSENLEVVAEHFLGNCMLEEKATILSFDGRKDTSADITAKSHAQLDAQAHSEDTKSSHVVASRISTDSHAGSSAQLSFDIDDMDTSSYEKNEEKTNNKIDKENRDGSSLLSQKNLLKSDSSLNNEEAHSDGIDEKDIRAHDKNPYHKGARQCVLIEALYRTLYPVVELRHQVDLLTGIEIPLAAVLAHMEEVGAAIDPMHLQEILINFKNKAEEDRQLALSVIPEEYADINLQSPTQLQKVLFEELELQGTKKTKRGYSTNAIALRELEDTTTSERARTFLQALRKYRENSKLAQMIETLSQSINPHDGRIHTTYEQTTAATGRLSSTDPNLQNIPNRNDSGREIRSAFVPSNSYTQLLSADYSQVELRIMAHLSGDKQLIEAFRSGVDFHRYAASLVYGISPDDVTAQQRTHVKMVSYGLAYGLSTYGLSQRLGITPAESQILSDRYFAVFGTVHTYLESLVEQARQRGYTETMFGRRRYFPALRSKNYQQRSGAERAALNAPIQGSAADIMKIAMNKADKALLEGKYRSRIILQIHDELVCELYPQEEEEVTHLIKETMENAVDLAVPLDVSTGVGDNWEAAAH